MPRKTKCITNVRKAPAVHIDFQRAKCCKDSTSAHECQDFSLRTVPCFVGQRMSTVIYSYVNNGTGTGYLPGAKTMKFFCLAILFLCLTRCASQQVPQVVSEPSRVNSVEVNASPTSPKQKNENLFVEVKPKTEHPFQVEFTTADVAFLIDENGLGKRTDSKGVTQNINLGLDNGEILEGLFYYAIYEGDLLLMFETYLNDGGAGFIARFNRSTLGLKWKRLIPAFNVGQGLINDKFAFVTAIGFVGKVNLESGVFAWKHDNLYGQKDVAFNSFEAPQIEGNIVRFVETGNYLRKTLARIEVDMKTGKVLKIER